MSYLILIYLADLFEGLKLLSIVQRRRLRRGFGNGHIKMILGYMPILIILWTKVAQVMRVR